MSKKIMSMKAARTSIVTRRTQTSPAETSRRKLHATATHYEETEDVQESLDERLTHWQRNDIKEWQIDENCTHRQRTMQSPRMSWRNKSTKEARTINAEKLCNTQNTRITISIKSTKAARTSKVDREDVQDDQVDESRARQKCTTQRLNNVVF